VRGSPFLTVGDITSAILDLAARRRYVILYGQEWDEGSEQGHDEAREAVTAEDAAAVAAVLWCGHPAPASIKEDSNE
jgi:hypothetical protein